MLSVRIPRFRISNQSLHNATDSSNLIHDDTYCSPLRLSRGAGAGSFDLRYMSRSLVELLGKEWLERGSAAVRSIVRPMKARKFEFPVCWHRWRGRKT